jgi:hypothetical protein
MLPRRAGRRPAVTRLHEVPRTSFVGPGERWACSSSLGVRRRTRKRWCLDVAFANVWLRPWWPRSASTCVGFHVRPTPCPGQARAQAIRRAPTSARLARPAKSTPGSRQDRSNRGRALTLLRKTVGLPLAAARRRGPSLSATPSLSSSTTCSAAARLWHDLAVQYFDEAADDACRTDSSDTCRTSDTRSLSSLLTLRFGRHSYYPTYRDRDWQHAEGVP